MLHNHLSSMGTFSPNKGGSFLYLPAQHMFAALDAPNHALSAHVFMLWPLLVALSPVAHAHRACSSATHG